MKTNFSQTQSEIFDLALDLYRGDFSRHIDETKVTKKDLENHLRDMINKDMVRLFIRLFVEIRLSFTRSLRNLLIRLLTRIFLTHRLLMRLLKLRIAVLVIRLSSTQRVVFFRWLLLLATIGIHTDSSLILVM